MPFIATNLTVLSAANGFTLWHYRTIDSRSETEAAGYFTPAADRVRVGDIIMVQAADGTTMLPVRTGNLTGAAVVLDALGTPPTIQRSANLPFTLTLSASAEARARVEALLGSRSLDELVEIAASTAESRGRERILRDLGTLPNGS